MSKSIKKLSNFHLHNKKIFWVLVFSIRIWYLAYPLLFFHSLKHHRHRPNPNRQSKLLQRRFSEIELDKSFRQESIREHPPVHFQKRREKSARVLITIVLTFLFCHTFRFVLKFYEVTHPSHSTPEHHNHCHEQERYCVLISF